MKKIFITCLFLFPLFSIAQDSNEGEIIYEQVIKLNFDMSKVPEHMKDMAKMMPKEQRFKKQLLFTEKASMYKAFNDPDAEAAEVAAEGPGMRMRMMMARNEEETYIEFGKNELIQKKEFFGRTFIIKDTLENTEWKVTGEQKEILGYPCMKATTLRDSMEITVWFAPTIPIASGPEGMGQLPGLILEASLKDGDITMVAEKFTPRKVSKSEMAPPKKGKEVTREEYREIVMEKMKEMRDARGGHGPGGGGHHMMMMHP